jgi:Penicillin-Binding Protein C-terminus Family
MTEQTTMAWTRMRRTLRNAARSLESDPVFVVLLAAYLLCSATAVFARAPRAPGGAAAASHGSVETARFVANDPCSLSRAPITIERHGTAKQGVEARGGSTPVVGLGVETDFRPGCHTSVLVLSPNAETPPPEPGEHDFREPASGPEYLAGPAADPLAAVDVHAAVDSRAQASRAAAHAPAVAAIRMLRPIAGMRLTYDSRLPPDEQGFAFEIAGLAPRDRVLWIIDGRAYSNARADHRWTIRRGEHRVSATVWRNGSVVAELPEVVFYVE